MFPSYLANISKANYINYIKLYNYVNYIINKLHNLSKHLKPR